MPLSIETVPWDSLKQSQNNPRNGDVDAIVESIRANDVYRPIITARDGTILAGHHLWYALGQLRRSEVDIVRLPVEPGSDQAMRILLADNRTADLGRYDEGLLLEILKEINLSDLGLIGTGYDDEFLRRLEEGARYDDWDETDNAGTKDSVPSGQKWRLGKHILICGDATDPSSWADCPQVMGVVTDPPYGIQYTGGRSKTHEAIANDGDGEASAQRILDAFALIPKSRGAVYYTFGGVGIDSIKIACSLSEIGAARWMLVWVKNNFNISRADYHPKHEVIWYGWYDEGHPQVTDRKSTSVIEMNTVPSVVRHHQNEKPVELMERLVGAHGFNKGTWIADPFAGSGSTLLACENKSLRCWAVEIDQDHCQSVISRWEEMTGRKAEPL